jgi:CarboxypepD_reg-like domain
MKSFQLQIPNPCTQPWSEMSVTDAGRHCAQCDKVVIDFSKMSDEEVNAVFQKNNGKICGHFKVSQLNRNIEAFNPYPQVSLPRILIGLTFYFLSHQSVAVEKTYYIVPEKEQVETNSALDNARPNSEGDSIKYIIKGKVRQFEKPIFGATVMIAGYNARAISNENGYFKLEITLPSSLKEIVIISSRIGFEDKTTRVNTKRLQSPIILEMHEQESVLYGDIKVIDKPTQTPKPRFK